MLARWQEFVGTGEFMRGLQARVGPLRDRVAAAVTGRPRRASELQPALESELVTLVGQRPPTAAEQAAGAWRGHPAGAALLARRDPLAAASAGLRAATERMVRDWQRRCWSWSRRDGGDRAGPTAMGTPLTGLACADDRRPASPPDLGGAGIWRRLADATPGPTCWNGWPSCSTGAGRATTPCSPPMRLDAGAGGPVWTRRCAAVEHTR